MEIKCWKMQNYDKNQPLTLHPATREGKRVAHKITELTNVAALYPASALSLLFGNREWVPADIDSTGGNKWRTLIIHAYPRRKQ